MRSAAGSNPRSRSKCREARSWAVSRSKRRRPSMESVPGPPSAAMLSRASGISPAAKTREWLARICSMSVVPDRGSPTTNTGSSLSNPKPRTRWKKSAVQAAIIRATRTRTLADRTPGRACATRTVAWRCPGQGARQPRHTRPARPGRGPGRSATTNVVRPSTPLARRRQNPAPASGAAARSFSGSLPPRSSANL